MGFYVCMFMLDTGLASLNVYTHCYWAAAFCGLTGFAILTLAICETMKLKK